MRRMLTAKRAYVVASKHLETNERLGSRPEILRGKKRGARVNLLPRDLDCGEEPHDLLPPVLRDDGEDVIT
ncbi:hypothetical protein PABG_11474 [Paracoccidioides brasiliensis Pb03]|nr:hypothetical protein PABG_11474 [Paracoccidioides brasiliensis Pb03]